MTIQQQLYFDKKVLIKMDILPIHEPQEFDDELEYSDTDIIETLRSNRVEIKERLDALENDINLTVALEELSSKCYNSEYLTEDIANRYSELVQTRNYSRLYVNSQISFESFDTLVNVASSITNTASNVSNKAIVAAGVVKDGLIKGAEFARMLYEKVQENIVKLAASWDLICSLIEKRWLGLKQLSEVYNLQHKNLFEKFNSIGLTNSSRAFFKVKLYVAKLRNDGRDISKKENLLDALVNDSLGIEELGQSFLNTYLSLKKIDAISARAFSFGYLYKKALAENANLINAELKNLTTNNIFTSGGFVKDFQAQSRVLVGGKVIYINYNYEELTQDSKRADSKKFISNLSFSSIKRKDGSLNDTETVEINDLSYNHAIEVFNAVDKTNEALANYFNSNLPQYLKDRQTISSLTKFATGLTGGNAAFDTIKRFFNNDDNLKTFNLLAPVPVAKLLATFLSVSTFAAFSGIVAAASAAYLIDYLRKYIIANLFTMMDLQYKITDIIEKIDHDYIDTLIEVHNQGYRVCKKLASSRSWER